MSKPKSISTKLKNASKLISEARKTKIEVSKKALAEVTSHLKTLIKSGQYFSRIEWDQYTPYFMDGDVCEFDVYDVQLRLSKKCLKLFKENNIFYYEDGSFSAKESYPLDEIQDSLKKGVDVVNFDNLKEFNDALKEIVLINKFFSKNEHGLLDAFGDHATVIVDMKGIRIDRCRHD